MCQVKKEQTPFIQSLLVNKLKNMYLKSMPNYIPLDGSRGLDPNAIDKTLQRNG